jgi:hypothetical protein
LESRCSKPFELRLPASLPSFRPFSRARPPALLARSPLPAMQIHIKKLDGQKEEFSLEPSDSVMKVKEMLAEKTGVHKDQIRLIFKGKPMNDEKTLAEQQVVAGATVHMIMQVRRHKQVQ